jgi:phosphorylcholine metabolism protein LicD
MNRPDIKNIKTGTELKRWYWLKQELVDYCRLTNLSYADAKFDILERIANALDNKIKLTAKSLPSKQSTSKFNWHKEKLFLDTVITDSYKNSQNARKFFQQHCGDKFHFSIPFMAFMKNNCGKTLQYAIDEWKKLYILRKDKNFKSEIPEGNQYNKYIRDFFNDNPNMTIKQARHFWKLKRNLPLGRHIYERTDLQLQ